MDWLFTAITAEALFEWEQLVGDWIFVAGFVILAIEFVRYLIRKQMSWALAGDSLANFITLMLYLGLGFVVYGTFYIAVFIYFSQFALLDIGINWATVIICIVLADLAYYWEHRFQHRVGIGWATHTVHHSSPFFNISVAYRFGPMDDFWSVFFHIPLVLIGFDPFVVLFAEIIVLLYQTFLHTELIGKLPRPIEAVMNTPSHHRVHHGSNDEYIDKNYAGILIIWDRMFGTFAEEQATVVYGITEPINSVNPLVIFLHGLARLGRQFLAARGVRRKLAVLLMPPGWKIHSPATGQITE